MDPIRHVTGTGTFTCTSKADAGEPFDSTFTLSFFPDSSAKIQADMVPARIQVVVVQDFQSPKFTTFSLHGMSEDGAIIDVDEMAVTGPAVFSVFSTIIMRYSSESTGECEARYGLTNLKFVGCQYRQRDGGIWLDNVPFTLNDSRLVFQRIQNYERVIDEMTATRQTRITAEVVCTIRFDEREVWNSVVDDIAWLSSFAGCEDVVPVYRDFFLDGRLILSELLTRHRVPYTGGVHSIPLDSPKPCMLSGFLESGYSPFTEVKESLSLRGMIYLFVKSQHPELALEVKYITMVMALESFCSHTELILENDQRCVPRKSVERAQKAIRKTLKERDISLDEEVIVEMGERAAFPHPDFRDKLQYALREFSIAYTDIDFESNQTRNTIVHTGQFPPDSNPVEEYYALSNLLLRIILTILDYRGEYVKRGPGFPLEQLPRLP